MHGKLVVITGAGREGQVGEAVAAAFGAQGAVIALIDVDAEQVAARARTLHAAGVDARGYAVDLTDANALADTTAQILADHPEQTGVTALICLAGG
ncbi:MAG: SDR family NAD(P)-dependent oxidoreductase, partial [Gemmatimonadaceae bacterium]|nr:SDR family NAD(P)-dependent oxidoreductase [Gemmatimonadaceae bacterium]